MTKQPFNLNGWREHHSLSQKRLALLIGTTQTRISRIERAGVVSREFMLVLKGLEASMLPPVLPPIGAARAPMTGEYV